MFDLGSLGEILIIGTVALVVIGPKDMPTVMRNVGKWAHKLRILSFNLRQGFDQYIHEEYTYDEKKSSKSDHFSSFMNSKEASFLDESDSSLNSSQSFQKSLHKSDDGK